MINKITQNMTPEEKRAAINTNFAYLLSIALPVGTIIDFAGDKIPFGALVCDGSEISREIYSDLFTAIGTTYGDGDGETTFNLPDLRGKVAVGLDENDDDFKELGASGGEKMHTLSTEEMPEHSHNASCTTGLTDQMRVLYAAGASIQPNHNVGYSNTEWYDATNGSNNFPGANHYHKVTIGNSGSGKAHNNLQPYTVTQKIIVAFGGTLANDKGVLIPIADAIAEHNTDPDAHPEIKRIYVQSTEPKTAKVGDIWIDTSESEDESGDDASNGSGLEPVPGVDGFSPLVNVTAIDGGHTVTITDAEGTHTFTVMNGKDGASGIDGKDGKDGTDGVSVTHSWNGTVLTVTSASGTSSADLKGAKGDKGDTGEKGEQGIQGVQGIQGEKGDKGDKGDTGTSGYTPKKGTDYFTSADKAELVDNLIEETGIDIVPDYVIAEAESVIDRVIAAQTGRVFTFAAISDMHYGNGSYTDGISSYTDGIKHACQALKYIDSRIKLDAVAVLGDYTDGYLTTGYDNAIADFKGINSLLGSLRFAPNLRQQGNHDFYVKHSSLTHRFIQAQSDDVVWGDKLGGYFYKDFEDYKLRVICVNANEKNGIDNNNKPIGNIACSVEQYNWFISSLDLSSKEDASDWQILILSHQPLDWYDSDAVYSFAQILNAYRNGTAWSNTTLGISCDYSGKNSATLISNIHGHIHNLLTDYIHFGNVANGNKSEIWRMATPEACVDRANQYNDAWHEDTTYAKTKGTAQDTSFCIYCIDLDTFTINAICYGAGYDRTLNYSDGTQIITFSITNVLTNVSIDNSAVSIQQGQPYNATLTASIEGDMSVTVTMGGEDVTSSVYANGLITISEVTGNIVITATVTAKEPTVTYTNQIPISIDTDGSVYNGKGYLENTRLNSSGGTTTLAGTAITGFIPVKVGDIVRFKNISYTPGAPTSVIGDYISLYRSDFSNVTNVKSPAFSNSAYILSESTTDEDSGCLASFKLSDHTLNYAYMRISCTGLDDTSVITVNEIIE